MAKTFDNCLLLINKANDNAVNTGMTTLNDIRTVPSNSLSIQAIG